jgi:hypothetical protein
VLGRLRAFPGPEHQVVTVDEVDPDPGVVLEAIVQHLDDRLEDVAVAGEDPVERLERVEAKQAR